jgi:tetraacyldisaccharide 4'-kinase
VARGYGAVADASGNTDEIALMAARVPEAEVIMALNKTEGAREAAARGVDVILIDDGYQHRRLERDLDVLVVDAMAPISNGYVVPLGGLREPPSGLGRADVMVLTHHESLSPEDIEGVVASLSAYRRDIPIVRATHTPIGVRPVSGGELQPTESLAGQDVFLFCGIASPDGFRRTVEGLGAHVTGVTGFPDHHGFTASSIAEVRAEARTALLVCTEKDAAKVAAIPGTEDVLCVVIDMVLDDELPPIPGLDG